MVAEIGIEDTIPCLLDLTDRTNPGRYSSIGKPIKSADLSPPRLHLLWSPDSPADRNAAVHARTATAVGTVAAGNADTAVHGPAVATGQAGDKDQQRCYF